jgi:hypothetical protein
VSGRSLPPGPMAGLAAVAIMVTAWVIAIQPGFHGVFSPLMRETAGPPVRWDACEAIHYVVNPDGAPPNALADVQEAARRVSAASGLTFVYDGTTAEVPSYDRQLYQPDRYGRRWAPVVVGWVPNGDNDLRLRLPKLGVGVPFPVRNTQGNLVFVSGLIGLNAGYDAPSGFASTTATGSVVLHEFGHLAGLGHVSARDEVMYPTANYKYPTTWGPGDSLGLFLLGRASGCEAEPAARPTFGDWEHVDFPDKPKT